MRTVNLLILLTLVASPLHAQDGTPAGRFLLGPVGWTPTIAIREAGLDSNVLNASTSQGVEEDKVVSFTPRVDFRAPLGMVELSSRAGVDVVYFQRLEDQRAVNGQISGRAVFPMTRVRPAISMQWERRKDRTGNELDVRVPQTLRSYGAEVTTQLGSRYALHVGATRRQIEYDGDAAFRDVNVGRQLNRTTLELGAALRTSLTPLTTFVVEGRHERDSFTLTPERQMDNVRGTAGLEFTPDAVIRGSASIGYHRMTTRGETGFPTSGLVTSMNLGYTLLGRTQFLGRVSRETTYSVLADEEYYLSTITAFDVLHNLVGPVDVVARVARERMDYSITPGGAGGRLDRARTVAGGLSFRISETGRIGVELDVTRRESTAGPTAEFERRRLFTTMTYGF